MGPLNAKFNAILVNKYKDGNDHLGAQLDIVHDTIISCTTYNLKYSILSYTHSVEHTSLYFSLYL